MKKLISILALNLILTIFAAAESNVPAGGKNCSVKPCPILTSQLLIEDENNQNIHGVFDDWFAEFLNFLL